MGQKGRKKALIGGGKRKAVSGRETKKGVKGIASNYIHRTKAVRRLQVSLKDFRRLCILKGIYPRDPKKKPHGKDKTYYHIKDIKFLMHEPLLKKFREMKIFLKRHKKALIKREFNEAKILEKTMKPVYNLDHLVKERYPSFIDAIRDLDDPLCMIFLFALLPSETCKGHEAKVSAECLRLAMEFQHWVVKMKALRKTFVSVKGIYYQAKVYGQEVTWLTPHKFKQSIPKDVDFRVMFTFLQFYNTLLRFINFKLYYDLGLRYPPVLETKKQDEGAYLAAMKVEERDNVPETEETSSPEVEPAPLSEQQQKMQDKIASVVENIPDTAKDDEDKGEQETTSDAEPEAKGEKEEPEAMEDAEEDAEDFEDPQDGDEESREVCIFSGLTFLLGREVPQDSLEFIILAGGGAVLRDGEISSEAAASEKITHEIIDRPTQKRKLFSRQYAQPQWVYDSFNVRALLPLEHYKPGVKLPPHLSPFVDDEKEGYIPKQREVLRSWGGKVGGEPPADDVEEGPKEVDENDDKELAKIMMTGKTKRLYDTMKRAEGKKDAKNEHLRLKRQRLEETKEK
mmetsp:Transcript_5103/g.9728  ORF Transcript_5103/g.9728 Transcript_5103/m.9728 type:complete len:568 (+) Transcript_5103:15-1718(+)